MKLFEQPEGAAEMIPRSSPTKYSQPLPSSHRHVGENGILYAGFVNGQVGFILRQRGEKEIREPLTRENRANEHPRGFFQSLTRIFFGDPR